MYQYTAPSTVLLALRQRFQVAGSIRVKGPRMGTRFPTLLFRTVSMRTVSSESMRNMTYIKGDNINSWAKRQLDILNKKQQNNPDPNGAPNETWWTDFKHTFKDAFTFT